MDSGIFHPNEETGILYRTVFGRTVIKQLMKRYAISWSSFPDFYRETSHVVFSGEKTGKRGLSGKGQYSGREAIRKISPVRQDDRQKRFVSPDEQWVYPFLHPFSGRFLRTECGSIVRCGHGWQEVPVIRSLFCLSKEGFGCEGFIQATAMSDYVPFKPNVYTVFY